MNDSLNSGLRFIDYNVNTIMFNTNKEFEDKPLNVKFNIDRFVEYLDDEDNTMLVTLDINIFENAEKNNFPFSLSVNVTGIFELENVHVDDRVSFAEVNAVAILFPYIRALVSTFTANANVPPLILPPINVVSLIENQDNRVN